MVKPSMFCTIFLIAVAAISCKPNYRMANNPNSPTVQLRDALMELAKGNIDRITGSTKDDEGYVLMYGYERDDAIRKFPISDTLFALLNEIRPPKDTELYVLAHYRGDEILEYAEWVNGVDFPYHPNYITPLLITGNPYAYKVDEKTNLIKLN